MGVPSPGEASPHRGDSNSAGSDRRARDPSLRRPWILWGAWCLLVLAAAIVGLRDIRRPLDRGFDGHQGAFWTQAAINFDRLGPGASHGIPIVNLDLPTDGDGVWRLDGSGWYPYPNHPPTTAGLAWLGWTLGGGFEAGHPGSSDAGSVSDSMDAAETPLRGPSGFEGALRLPFFTAHLLALFAFAFLLMELAGPSRSLCGLALLATAPGVLLYADLVNVENPALAPLLLGLGFGVRAARTGRRSSHLACGAAMALAGCITWAPLAFIPPFALTLARRHGLAAGLRFGWISAMCSALPLLAWGAHVERVLGRAGMQHQGIGLRIKTLLGPLVRGEESLLPWFARQGSFALHVLGPAALALAVLGLALPGLRRVAAARWPPGDSASPRASAQSGSDGAVALLLGGLLANLAFFRHSLEAQESFQLWLAPGLCALGARILAAPTQALLRFRAGVAPQVLLVGTVALFSLADFEVQKHGLRAPRGSDGGPGLPAPELELPSVLGLRISEVLPPRAIGLLPSELGTTPAVGLYAWRSLLVASGPNDPLALGQAATFAPDPRTAIWVLLPSNPPQGAKAAVEDWQRQLLAKGSRPEDARVSNDGSWRAWPWTEVTAPGHDP